MTQDKTNSLELRISEINHSNNMEKDFQAMDWLVLAISGVVIPAALLMWGWN